MKKIRDYLYLLFRPKWERRLYKLLRNASRNNALYLDTVLYDFCNSDDAEEKILKAGVDAMFVGWVGVFDVINSSKQQYRLQAQDVNFDFSSDGDAVSEYATHKVLYYNQPLKYYIRAMARYISSDKVSNADRQFLVDLLDCEFLGLRRTWERRQVAIRLMMQVLLDSDISINNWYSENFADADYKCAFGIRAKFCEKVGIKHSAVPPRVSANNWMSVMAYYASNLS